MKKKQNQYPEARSWLFRLFWLGAGWLFVALAVIGAILPVMPTVPFVLLAAACFSRGSKKIHTWLRNHPSWGPPLRDWEDNHCIPRRARNIGLLMMWVSIGVTGWLIKDIYLWLSWSLVVVAVMVTIYMLSLPLRENIASL